MKKFLLGVLICIFCPLVIAQNSSSEDVKLFPDFDETSLNDLGTFGESDEVGTEFGPSIVGRDVSRTFNRGDNLENVLQLGDLQTSLAPQQFSLAEISDRLPQPLDFKTLSLSDFPLVEAQTLENLVDIVPDLGNLTLRQVEPIRVLLQQEGFFENRYFSQNTPLRSLVNNSEIGNLDLGMLDREFSLLSIPNLTNAEIGDFEGFQSTIISNIPGLADVPLSQFPNEISVAGNFISRIDFVWGGAESRRYSTISGSYLEGFNVPCESNCEHLELDDIENIGAAVRLPFEGKQWIAGREHYVAGGSGCLVGLEPTGIHPFGKVFKVVLWRTDEERDRALIVLFFNFSTFCGESPYILGPVFVPFGIVNINDYIFIGSGS